MMKDRKEFIEKMGLVIIIVSIVGGATIDAKTTIIQIIGIGSMAFTFLVGISFYIFPDKVLELQYRSMKHKKVVKR